MRLLEEDPRFRPGLRESIAPANGGELIEEEERAMTFEQRVAAIPPADRAAIVRRRTATMKALDVAGVNTETGVSSIGETVEQEQGSTGDGSFEEAELKHKIVVRMKPRDDFSVEVEALYLGRAKPRVVLEPTSSEE